ncbi:hypothetical protein [Mycobacterium sp. AZCC_0083]|uniref:hypothetical protein n=1 Tax=Mycobacterium sp. AZCC_0083 TaxID=2735882 RepID=UPI0016108605|nr:hypothetical protein [Mycobacterium sp. AZCC_0083]MBB5167169.1 hypothetical protein [Mycobacterium sp. AZCC_0083]
MGTNKLRRIARRNHAVLTDDPDGLISTLQITKRLLQESINAGEPVTIITALEYALEMSAPKDPHRTWWSALRVILRNTTVEKSTLAILADAIEGQGKTNRKIKQLIAA